MTWLAKLSPPTCCASKRAPGDAKASREKLVACPLADQVRLAGQLRLVHLHRSVAHHGPIDDDLVSRTDDQQVAAHDLARIDALLATVADYLRRRAGQKGDSVELALGAHLLEDAHAGVREHHHQREDRVQGAPEKHQQQAQHVEDVVDEAEDVSENDLAVGAPGRRRRNVDLAARLARRHLARRQAANEIGRVRD